MTRNNVQELWKIALMEWGSNFKRQQICRPTFSFTNIKRTIQSLKIFLLSQEYTQRDT